MRNVWSNNIRYYTLGCFIRFIGPINGKLFWFQEKQSIWIRCIWCVRFILVCNGWCLVNPNGVFRSWNSKRFRCNTISIRFCRLLIFSIFGTIASLKTNKVVFAIKLLICFLFFGLATDLFLGGKTGFFALAAWSELFISLLGFYGSGAVLVNKVFGKTVFPLGKSIL